MNNVKRRRAGTARAESKPKRLSEAEGHLGKVCAMVGIQMREGKLPDKPRLSETQEQ